MDVQSATGVFMLELPAKNRFQRLGSKLGRLSSMALSAKKLVPRRSLAAQYMKTYSMINPSQSLQALNWLSHVLNRYWACTYMPLLLYPQWAYFYIHVPTGEEKKNDCIET